MTGLTGRFVLLIATAAIAPLVIYGVVSVSRLSAATETSVTAGNLRVAQEVAERISQYIRHDERILRSIGLELRTPGLEPWMQTRILKDFVLDFPEFREISMFNAAGQVLATSRVTHAQLSVPDAAQVTGRDV